MPRRTIPPDLAAFAGLPVRMITTGAAGEQVAVHVAGRLGGARLPVLCLPGYVRNMVDFTEFVPLLQRQMGAADWPVVLLDMRGRGRSTDRRQADDYATTADARDVAEVARALAIERAAFVGLGHGGQVTMALAANRPALIAAAVLVDAGPVIAPQSLIRLRSNFGVIVGSRGAGGTTVMLRRMLAADYPGLGPEELDRLAARTHGLDAQGRAEPWYDAALIERLKDFALDDVLLPQWQLFDLLGPMPVMFLKTEFTDQLPREIFDEMLRRRPDAANFAIAGQGSPALLAGEEEVAAVAQFLAPVVRATERPARRAA